ncbi:hypothetical protein Droror1_Dr00011279 [Drosera rotundifolia]
MSYSTSPVRSSLTFFAHPFDVRRWRRGNEQGTGANIRRMETNDLVVDDGIWWRFEWEKPGWWHGGGRREVTTSGLFDGGSGSGKVNPSTGSADPVMGSSGVAGEGEKEAQLKVENDEQ